MALSSFINAMYELDSVAIVRYCFRKNAAPKLGLLSPHIKQNYEVRNLSVMVMMMMMMMMMLLLLMMI